VKARSAKTQHAAAVRAGWNDAAWGRPRREIEAAVAPSYERGYAGGLVFRAQQQHSAVRQAEVPRLVKAA
jgi:hypothetical protein